MPRAIETTPAKQASESWQTILAANRHGGNSSGGTIAATIQQKIMTLSAEEFIRRFLLHEKRADLKKVVVHWNDCRSRPLRIRSIIQTKSCG